MPVDWNAELDLGLLHDDEIAKRHDTTPGAVQSARARRHIPAASIASRTADKATARRLRARGMTLSDIAEVVDTHATTVLRWLRGHT